MEITQWIMVGVGVLAVLGIFGLVYYQDMIRLGREDMDEIFACERKYFIKIGRCYYQVSRMKKFVFDSGDAEGHHRVRQGVLRKKSAGGYIRTVYKGSTYYIRRVA